MGKIDYSHLNLVFLDLGHCIAKHVHQLQIFLRLVEWSIKSMKLVEWS
jgi:hypothetical protein